MSVRCCLMVDRCVGVNAKRSLGTGYYSISQLLKRRTFIGVLVCVAACSLAVACASTKAPTEDGAKVTGNTMFTFSGVAEGHSKHYILSPQGALEPQGGDPRKDATFSITASPSPSSTAPASASPSTGQADDAGADEELSNNDLPSGVEPDSGSVISWKPLTEEEKVSVSPDMLTLFRILEDASDRERLGLSYGTMELGVLVVALPEGVLLSWDKEKYVGDVEISRNGTVVVEVPVEAGSYLYPDVTKLNEYSYKIVRNLADSGEWESMSLDVSIPPAFDRTTLKEMIFQQATAYDA